MPILRSLLLLLIALPVCRSAAGQDQRPAGHGTLTGIVRDSASGAPAPGLLISVGLRTKWTDSSGRYVHSLSPGLHRLRISCDNWPMTIHEPEEPVRIVLDSTFVLDLLVHPRVCTEPDSVDAEFVGYYHSAFELSAFVPCPGTIERVWRPLLDTRDVWVDISNRAWRAGRRLWPTTKLTTDARYFVRWKGRLTGPGRYGHLGGARYLLRVDRILEVRTPGPGDCG